MKEVGEFLKNSRQDRQITLGEISERTKIQQHYLEALEQGDFGKFHGEVYLKGALRSYAESIGLDPGEVLELYRSRKGEAAPVDMPEAAGEKKAALPGTIQGERGPSFIYAIVVAVLLLAAGGYWLASRDSLRNPFEPRDPESQTGVVDPENSGSPDQENRGDGEKEPGPAAADIELSPAESTARETVFSVSNTEQLELKLTSGEPCWIKALMDGREQFEPRNLGEGEELALNASETIWIRLGNPRSIRLILNGIELKGIGGKREPHNVLFVRK